MVKNKKEVLCCRIDNMNEEERDNMTKIFSNDSDYIVHDDRYFLYYPSKPPNIVYSCNCKKSSYGILWFLLGFSVMFYIGILLKLCGVI